MLTFFVFNRKNPYLGKVGVLCHTCDTSQPIIGAVFGHIIIFVQTFVGVQQSLVCSWFDVTVWIVGLSDPVFQHANWERCVIPHTNGNCHGCPTLHLQMKTTEVSYSLRSSFEFGCLLFKLLSFLI